MNRTLRNAFLLSALVLAPAAATAEIGTIDDVPAATLLLPHFQVDLDDPTWWSTLFSINNAAAEPAIAHVTLWTDLSVPTLDFNVYLTGYDVVTVNLRDLFESGTVPQTSHNNDAISNVGIFSNLSSPLTGVGPGSTSCNGQLPLPVLPPTLLTHIRAAHTGQPSPVVFGGACSGQDFGDNIARGYITIDNVNFCSLDFPGDAGYFIAGGTGVANNENQLWGDYFFVDGFDNVAFGENLVHIEADDTLGAANYTFYRRYSGGADQREGLGNLFLTRFIAASPATVFSRGTELLVWRDAKRVQGPFACGSSPAWYPLGQNEIVVFDEEENPGVPESSPFSPAIPGEALIPFPAESNRVQVGGDDFPVSPSFGWLYLNLNTTVVGSAVPFEPLMQNWVTVAHTADDRFGVAYDAVTAGNVTVPATAPDLDLPVCDGAPDPPACN